jgi:hypothetical protein
VWSKPHATFSARSQETKSGAFRAMRNNAYRLHIFLESDLATKRHKKHKLSFVLLMPFCGRVSVCYIAFADETIAHHSSDAGRIVLFRWGRLAAHAVYRTGDRFVSSWSIAVISSQVRTSQRSGTGAKTQQAHRVRSFMPRIGLHTKRTCGSAFCV